MAKIAFQKKYCFRNIEFRRNKLGGLLIISEFARFIKVAKIWPHELFFRF